MGITTSSTPLLEVFSNSESQVAMWTTVGAVATAFITSVFAYLTNKSNKKIDATNDLMEKELHFQSAALDFSEYMAEWNEITAMLLALFRETKIDRFLILRAWNGTLTPKWTTAFFQLRQEGQQPYTYTHVQLDEDYVTKLRDTISRGHMIYEMDTAPESLIKSIYDAEGIKHSAWFNIDKRVLKDSDSASLTYCSFASHEDEPFTDEELLRCRMVVSRIKGIAQTMNDTYEG